MTSSIAPFQGVVNTQVPFIAKSYVNRKVQVNLQAQIVQTAHPRYISAVPAKE
jgi:hypothetical protein